MKRVLSGIQPSGQLHLGNYVGAIKQWIDMQVSHEMYIFVASYHAMTSARNSVVLQANTTQVVIDLLAFGLDPARVHIYRQQDVPEVTELAWLLSTVCPKHMMDKATSYKDKVEKGIPATIGLYTYPVLQAADILSVDADVVPVGADQVQHCEIARDLAQKFNHYYGTVFKLPTYQLREELAVLPGIDGQKMSKSYDNTIDPFMNEKSLRKRVMKIKTDSTPAEAPKDPDQCNVFQIVRSIAGPEDHRTLELERHYRAGGFGYGEAKQMLYDLILEYFGPARTRRDGLMQDPRPVEQVLQEGGRSAREIASAVTTRARQAAGL